MNESSQVAIEEVLTELRLAIIQSLINERIMRGEIRRMKKVNGMQRVRGMRAIGRMRGVRSMQGAMSMRRVGGMRGIWRMRGVGGCGRLGGQVERIAGVSVSKCYRPTRKPFMRSATYIEMGERNFGETIHTNKEYVLYQKKCESPPN
jgi:hypothetical protein